jgi:hypothetical protein
MLSGSPSVIENITELDRTWRGHLAPTHNFTQEKCLNIGESISLKRLLSLGKSLFCTFLVFFSPFDHDSVNY